MAMTLITTNTITSATSVSAFTSGIDSTYKLYIFKFYDVRPSTDNIKFAVDFSTDGGSSYGMTKTTSFFYSYQTEDGNTSALEYVAGHDEQQSTNPQKVTDGVDTGEADCSAAGELFLFNPSSSTYVKHFYGTSVNKGGSTIVNNHFGGYVNSTNDVDAVQFKFESGNIATSVIKMYGVG